MPLVVGVSFRKVGKVYYFDPGDLDLHEGDFAIAETARGVEFGEVVLEPREVPDEELVAPLKRIVRKATGADLNREANNREKEKNAFEVCDRKIAEHGLQMKLLEAECAFDGSQVTFSFSADGRIDFRELVKDVASVLKAKVQLHQIGVRDEAKLVGGYGGCGRPLCCATFLSNFEPISMKMAKDQSLFLNPAKFSGCCGKLMCCLRYEHEHYKMSQRCLPAVGAILELENGTKARVIDVNVISYILTLETEDEVQLHVPASQLKLEGTCRKHGVVCGMQEKNCQALLADPDAVPLSALEDDDCEDESVDEVVASYDTGMMEIIAPPSLPQREKSAKGVTFREPTTVPQPKPQSENGNGNGGNGEKTEDPQEQAKRRNRNRNNGRSRNRNNNPNRSQQNKLGGDPGNSASN